MRTLSSIIALTLLSFAVSAAPPGPPEHNLYLTAAAKDDVPGSRRMRDFDCFDRIYAVLELSHYPRGRHRLEAVWADPYQRVRERTGYEFRVAATRTRTWVWMELHPPKGAALARFFLADPADGMQAFIGEWRLRLSIDGQRLGSQHFLVSC